MKAIGLVEVKNVARGIKVTDEMLKSAGVFLIQSTLRPVWRRLFLSGASYADRGRSSG